MYSIPCHGKDSVRNEENALDLRSTTERPISA